MIIGALLPVLNSGYEVGVTQILLLIGGMLAVIVWLEIANKRRK